MEAQKYKHIIPGCPIKHNLSEKGSRGKSEGVVGGGW
jgi:hypothetical protein